MDVHITLIFILVVRKLFGLSTISLEGLMINTFRGSVFVYKKEIEFFSHEGIFDRERIFETKKKKVPWETKKKRRRIELQSI